MFRNFIVILSIFFICNNVFAKTALTSVAPGVLIYSEYYPNPNSKFKGTIIFENGSGTDITEWKSNHVFFNCIRKIGSVFLYDRNGLGHSPPDLRINANNPITAKFISDKLSILLEKRHIPSPYIFVTHSYGAVYTAYFVLKNPNSTKAILFVDPVPKDFYFSDEIFKKYGKGVKEAQSKPSNFIYKKYQKSDAEVIYQLLGFETSKKLLKKLGAIDNTIPITIISSTGMETRKPAPIKSDWYTSQKQWLNQNSDSKIIQVHSSHFIQIDQPQIICNQLKLLISKVKK